MTQKMLTIILGIGWGLCEVLNAIPSVKSNSAVELIITSIQTVIASLKGNPPSS